MSAADLESDALRQALLERLSQQNPSSGSGFPGAGFLVGLLGFDDGSAPLRGSASLHQGHQRDELRAVPSALDQERAQLTADCCAELQEQQLAAMVQPVGDGGLLLALARCCLPLGQEGSPAVGAAVVLPAPRQVGAADPPSIEQQLFHDSIGRYLLCIPAHRQADARLLATAHGVPLWPLGRTGGRELVIRASDGESTFREVFRLPLGALPVLR
jgi:phosphoribosylformylglycinamidine synthase